VLCVVRAIFSRGGPRDRDSALRQLAAALGYHRVGPIIRETLNGDLLSAARRGIISNERGQLALLCRSVEDYDRSFLKDQFVAAIGRSWNDREAAANALARWLGFARTGPTIHATARSLINGLLRENRLETNGDEVRKL
jgi:hypothetical protein